MLLVQGDVFNTKRATTDGVSLVLVLLVSGSQGQLVNEVQSNRSLADSHLFRLEI